MTLQRSTDALEIAAGALGERAATVGLVHLVLDKVLAPAEVDDAFAAGTHVTCPSLRRGRPTQPGVRPG